MDQGRRDVLERRNGGSERGEEGGNAAVAGDEDLVKRPRSKTNSNIDEKHDATSSTLQESLHDMMTQKEVRDERKRQGKEEQMKICMELQTKKLDMEKATKKKRFNIGEVAQTKKLAIETTNVETKTKEVSLAIMNVDLTNMSPKRRSWFESQQHKMVHRVSMN
ncbi:Receptor-like protein kinase HSL1 [Hordeum vulgare]|nr:Receptor-like protein kinase HSL1 [Hordeum vulgare]